MTALLSRNRRGRLAAVGAVIVALAAGWWAGRVTLTERDAAADRAPAPVTVEVVQGTVGRSLALTATVSQPFVPVASNALAGVVTAAHAGEVQVGGALYEVGGRAVRAVVGAVPFYRDLAPGVAGEDVRQLQQALVSLGYPSPTDGRFSAATGAAVRQWQRAAGDEATGILAWTQLVAVPRLPDVVRLGDQIVLGAQLSGGETSVLARAGEATFGLVVTSAQAQQIPLGTTATVTWQDQTWPARISGSAVDENQQTVLQLLAPDGGAVCRDQCGRLPAEAKVSLQATVQVVPELSGPAVPVAAITTDPSGAASVERDDGVVVPVRVLASQGGTAVVDGVEVGTRLVLLAADG